MIELKMAFYRKEDWNRFLDSVDDKDNMYETWKEWHESYLKGKRMFIEKGFKVYDVEVDINELIEYCKLRGIKNDSKARSEFVSNK